MSLALAPCIHQWCHIFCLFMFLLGILSLMRKTWLQVFKMYFFIWYHSQISNNSSNIFATIPYAGSVSDPSWLQPALVRSDCYRWWSPGAQLGQHQQNRLASGHDRHDPTPDDPKCCQSSGRDLQTAAATQDCVRLNGSSFCHRLGGVGDMFGGGKLADWTARLLIALNLSSMCVCGA